jgi:hypothetical protein
MKLERFIKEYANSKKKSFIENDLMKEDIKQKALIKIDTILKERERGRITIDETLLSIINVFED